MSFTAFDHQCMAEALRLARKGLKTTHPNPRVGCVIAFNGEIIGRGWHQKAGEAHAEVFALQDAAEKSEGATAYVTLEPCSHSGRTPPCADALVKAKIQRVVCAVKDPCPAVNGAGIQHLQQAGIEVESGLMSVQAEELNRGFLTRMRQGRPWVRVKLAQSIDGHIGLANGSSQWISGTEARADVQNWRARSDAILTGIGTVLSDDPCLNVRHQQDARQPLRVIVDSHWRIPTEAKLLGLEGQSLVAGLQENTVSDALQTSSAHILGLASRNGRVDLTALMQELAKREINEVQVEAGPTLCGALLEEALIDEILIYQAPVILGGGAVSPFAAPRLDKMDDRVHLQWIDSRRIGKDMRLRLKPVYQES